MARICLVLLDTELGLCPQGVRWARGLARPEGNDAPKRTEMHIVAFREEATAGWVPQLWARVLSVEPTALQLLPLPSKCMALKV